MSELHHVTVLGAGVLGGQIAWHSAFKGKTVVVYDIAQEPLDQCNAMHEQYASIYLSDVGASDEDVAQTRARLTFTTDLIAAVAHADLVIEAVPEIPDVKTKVYEEMAGHLPEHALIATNSSTLLPRDFADATGRPDKYCALHFANLIWMMNVVEIMAHPGTTENTLTEIVEFALEIGMLPIAVQKEQNGYVLNTWFVALLNASMSLVANEISTPEDVDRTYMVSNRGCAMGPMGLIDVVGMKTAYDVFSHWGHVNDDAQMRQNADYLKTNFIDHGKTGMQCGRGFYTYPDPAYQHADFLAVPDISCVSELVARIKIT
ncbi:3-hydroxyacyl-CoA dehydrogenase [Rhodococcus sp. H29-C3]|uniref:3-hydroxyacyl-CoA dehydrogenase n=1 Tax=Rhodococcus sp. H29-C3 TaxID=3046307 RepID=UPI0024BB03B9|nr:3-hydroxyacyl-CoA dehydrogenase [Rhodococcus sp. H29-C3]MDJ0359041.1 3-hydroxyacyl-CoA dehydrogenase [Rhodococcus sp. H29-C3]